MKDTVSNGEFLRANVMNTLRYHRHAYRAFMQLCPADQDEIIHALLWLRQKLGLSLGAGFELVYMVGRVLVATPIPAFPQMREEHANLGEGGGGV